MNQVVLTTIRGDKVVPLTDEKVSPGALERATAGIV